MTGPVRNAGEVPVTGTVTLQGQAPVEGPVADAVADITDGSRAAGGEAYGPPVANFEQLAALPDDELQALAEKYGVDTSTGLPKGVLVQEIHNRLTGVTPADEPVALAPVPVDPSGLVAGSEPALPDEPAAVEDTGDPQADSIVTVEKVKPGGAA